MNTGRGPGRPPKLRDPADGAKQQQEEAQIVADEKSFDISNLKREDFAEITLADARSRHPFEGYPEKKIKVIERINGKSQDSIVNATHLILFEGELRQDPSGKNVSLGYPELRDGSGRVIRPSTEKRGDIPTRYSAVAKDYESGGQNMDIVFDRMFILDDGSEVLGAFVSSPSVRAQLLYEWNSKTERIEARRPKKGDRVVGRFVLPDAGQVSRLRRVFEMIINPRIRLEESMRRTFDEDLDTTNMASLPGIPEGQE